MSEKHHMTLGAFRELWRLHFEISYVALRDGRPVAELRPIRARGVAASVLLARWRHLPAVDPERLRHDVDTLIDQSL